MGGTRSCTKRWARSLPSTKPCSHAPSRAQRRPPTVHGLQSRRRLLCVSGWWALCTQEPAPSSTTWAPACDQSPRSTSPGGEGHGSTPGGEGHGPSVLERIRKRSPASALRAGAERASATTTVIGYPLLTVLVRHSLASMAFGRFQKVKQLARHVNPTTRWTPQWPACLAPSFNLLTLFPLILCEMPTTLTSQRAHISSGRSLVLWSSLSGGRHFRLSLRNGLDAGRGHGKL